MTLVICVLSSMSAIQAEAWMKYVGESKEMEISLLSLHMILQFQREGLAYQPTVLLSTLISLRQRIISSW